MTKRLLHPRDEVAQAMARIYAGGMTTTSGGNISVREESGDVWVSPGGTDKGALTPADVVCVRADGTVDGHHPPSSESPFHRAIYARRPDVRAIIHAHPPALVAFSIVRQAPDTRVIPQAQHVCGQVGYAPYKLPGSEALGESIAEEFAAGSDAVIMENHGTVVGGRDLTDAFQRFETLEFCGRTLIKAHEIGTPRHLSEDEIRRFEDRAGAPFPELSKAEHPAEERALRQRICKFVERACRQGLMISTYGTVSVRWKEAGDAFLITPTGTDRRHLAPEALVQVRGGKAEAGKVPSRSVRLHEQIYAHHPHVESVITTQSPNATAFAITGQTLDTRTIPESYILLKDIPVVPYGGQLGQGRGVVEALSPETPIVLIQNDAILVTGQSLLDAFDRLEVAEFSARSLIGSLALGKMVPIGETDIEALQKKFL